MCCAVAMPSGRSGSERSSYPRLVLCSSSGRFKPANCRNWSDKIFLHKTFNFLLKNYHRSQSDLGTCTFPIVNLYQEEGGDCPLLRKMQGLCVCQKSRTEQHLMVYADFNLTFCCFFKSQTQMDLQISNSKGIFIHAVEGKTFEIDIVKIQSKPRIRSTRRRFCENFYPIRSEKTAVKHQTDRSGRVKRRRS